MSDDLDEFDDILEEGFDFNANLDTIRKKLSPAVVKDAIFSEEEASNFIDEYFDAEISMALSYDEMDTHAHSTEMIMDKFYKTLMKRQEKIIKAKNAGTNEDKLIAEVENVAKVLREFLRAFCRGYILFAPTPARGRFSRSKGLYVRSSIMYFTNDEASRRNALMKALSAQDVPSSGEEFIFGQSYVLKQLTPYRLFYRDGNIEKRIERVLGGISVENVASKKKKNGNMYYYGWINVEREGWKKYTDTGSTKGKKNKKRKPKTRAPYAPFAHALEYAKNISKGLIDAQFHDDINMYSTWSQERLERFGKMLTSGKPFPKNIRRTRG